MSAPATAERSGLSGLPAYIRPMVLVDFLGLDRNTVYVCCGRYRRRIDGLVERNGFVSEPERLPVAGELPCFRVGRSLRIDRDLLAWQLYGTPVGPLTP